jgi:tRNA A-37 threonylcarbamoyl transferase component Bud32
VSCPDENVLGLLVEGGLEDRGPIERHLDGCAACSAVLAELGRLAAPARSVPARYRIVRQLGAGAMGVVWEAEDRMLKRRVALKWVRPDRAADGERRARLLREARALAQLRHPNVVAVHDVGELGTELYLALELVDGATARAWRAGPGARSPDEILALWRQAAAGLAAIHRAGIVHRDVKPDNVLVARDGRVLIGDLGLATGDLDDPELDLTVSGQLLGTPAYMSPEQLTGEPATANSDQFALCVCLWEALAGTRPFAGASIAALAVAMLAPPVIPAGVDRALFATLLRGLAPDPAHRWPDVAGLLDALSRRPAGGWRRAGLGIAAALALGGGAVTWRAMRSPQAPAPVVAVVRADAGARPDAAVVVEAARASSPATPAPAATAVRPPLPVAAVADRRVRTPATRPDDAAARAGAARSSPTTGEDGGRAVSPWLQRFNRASDLLRAGDAAACVRSLADVPAVPAHVLADLEALRAQCTMRAGDCPGGRAVFAAALRASGTAPDRAAALLDAMDAQYCALDARPEDQWPVRAWYQLQVVAAGTSTCKPVLDFIDRHELQPPDARAYQLLRVTCEVRDGDCAAARARWYRLVRGNAPLDPAAQAAGEAGLAAAFDRGHPSCAR